MKLHYNKGSRATRVRWMLEEMAVPYEIVHREFGPELKTPEHLALHPLGQLPAFEDGEIRIFESAAIIMYLADSFPGKGMAPEVGTAARAAYYQWIIFGMATLEASVYTYFQHTRLFPEEQRQPVMAEHGKALFAKQARVLDAHLASRTWMLGDDFTAADIVIGSVLAWAAAMGLVEGTAHVASYVERCRARPAFRAGRQ